MAAMLSIEQLTVERGGNTVLDNISFEVTQGEVYALLGGNGAGKSTTLLTLLGFIEPVCGRATVNGIDVQNDTQAVRRQTAYLPEATNLYGHLSGRENVEYLLELAAVRPDRAALDAAFDQVRLAADARDSHMVTYSKGMRQKVAIASAILRQTPILLLDEPTSGLDPLAIEEFNAIVVDLASEGKTILMVTHDLYGACEVAQRVGILRHGRFVSEFDAAAEQHGGRVSADAVRQAFIEAAV
ncbi:MAG: ATP-binding cassette domain-containing protein [Pseudomonadota bacterium]